MSFAQFLKKPIFFRYGFFTLLIFSVVLNGALLNGNDNLYILYIFAVVFLGIGFFNKPTWILILFTVIVVACRYFLIPDGSNYNIGNFLIHLFTYLLITLISSGLMNYVQKVKDDHLKFITVLTKALDSRDTYTMYHSENVAKYAVQIAEKMKLPKDCCEIIHKGALLHDLGKIGIPEHVLMKNGSLNEDEYKIIKNHPTIGYNMLKYITDFSSNGILDIVLYHHERYDGKGYPKGLKGKQIPLFARIVAVADTFDAMTTKRVYRKQINLKNTINEIKKHKGTQFDPEIVDVFLSLFENQKLEGKETELPITNRLTKLNYDQSSYKIYIQKDRQ
ncbi:HD domain-containing phosphohydrolase [Bacillus sp. JJ1521]|uniref:HD-GYP domain-containing protein n=1 Tax=Bacillus sp. JJ1521 TaxID=3122957 RepID=UPI002FFD9E97